MPGFNKTGPDGTGPLTGRGRGMCPKTGYKTFVNDGTDGAGAGRGRGRGMRRGRGQGQGQGLMLGRRFTSNQELKPKPANDVTE